MTVEEMTKMPGRPRRTDIEDCYRVTVCETINEMGLKTMDTGAMIKTICRAYFYHNLEAMKRFQIVTMLAYAFDMTEYAVNSYLPTIPYKWVNVVQKDTAGRMIADFPNIPQAALATGISRQNIHKSITAGSKTGGYYFTAEEYKPEFV
jgi:hypothetical protein